MGTTKDMEMATHQTELTSIIGEFKNLQQESILISKLSCNAEHKEAMLALATLLRATPVVLRKVSNVQTSLGTTKGIDIQNFAELEALGEEISESIVLEDWILLSDILEFEYVALIQRWIDALEEVQEELLS